VSQYYDLRTAGSIVVKGGTAEPVALDWLTQAGKVGAANYEQQLAAMVTANHLRGLLATSGVFDGVEVTVSWGLPPAQEAPSGPVSSLKDMRTGVSIATRGSVVEGAKEWLASAGKAQAESDLNALVAQNHSRGLLSATAVFDGVRVTTSCAGAER
jgi:hypothetical protein